MSSTCTARHTAATDLSYVGYYVVAALTAIASVIAL